MTYVIVAVDNAEVVDHFKKTEHLIKNKIPTHYNEPRITKVWVCHDKNTHTWDYQIHL